MGTLFLLFLVVLLVAANAFFVAAEFALVSVRDTRIQHLVDTRRLGARTVQKLHANLDEVLSAVQFGITLASIALGWVGEPAIAGLVERVIGDVPYVKLYAHTIGFVIAFAIITTLHVILGEVVPKTLALQRAERVALAVSGPMDVFMKLARPALYFMNHGANLVLKLFGSQQMREGGVHSPEELKLVVTASTRVGLLPKFQEDMIHRALDLGNVTVREIMVPRSRIFSLPADMPLDEAITRVVEEQHSRVPVYDPTLGPESIIGLLYSKDLSRFMHFKLKATNSTATSHLSVRNVMREVLVVPETKPVTALLEEFQSRKRHLAVVVDEFGSTAGVVTVEDALEQVVGELEDEFDVVEQPTLLMSTGTAVLDGTENIRDLENRYRLSLPREEGFETLAGFILSRLGKIPHGGEVVEHSNRRFTVLSMDGHRIAKVKVETLEGDLQAESR